LIVIFLDILLKLNVKKRKRYC